VAGGDVVPRNESLDELIAKRAGEFADQMREVASVAGKEEEIRIETEKQLAFIQKEAGIQLEGRHEFTVASGHIDSLYDRVIIEYKNPSSPGARIGPTSDSAGSKKVVEQIKKRFYDMRAQHRQPLNTLFGVGFDGVRFIFVRFREDKWQVQDPVDVNKHSAFRFLWALFNLGEKGRPFSPEYLAGDFGSEAKLAQDGVRAFYDTISATDHPKAQTFFRQWKILFGEVCGYDVDSPSAKIKKLADFYGVPTRRLKPAELLFAVHTYYAIFMKLLASGIVGFFHRLPRPLEKMMQAGTSGKLKHEMEELEAGSIFRHLNITNFLEGDLFAWYTSIWSDPIENLVRNMVARLDNYNPGTLSEDPTRSRDLLKKLYQQLFPKSVRHDLGEYYTPDWLAEHVLNELGYVGDPDKRLLDPACGSGTFLVMAISRIRQWYDENRENCRFAEDDLCRKILANVVGFDLNPLAVMAARTNYLIAIRDLITHVDKVEMPVYLCDSILTPSEYGDLFTGSHGNARELKTAAARFLVPAEITKSRDDVAKYADQLEFCVRNGYSPTEFIQRCQDEGLAVTAQTLHTDLYNELVKLDEDNKNGVWARIIKNAFAPLFVGRVDYVAGNPPWVNWENLPEEYRDTLKPLWQQYGLFSLSGSAGRLGGGKKDLSMLFVYAAVDNYLPQGGRLGFVITQTVFKTKGAGDGFRRLQYLRDEKPVVLKPVAVHDLSRIQVFEGATNRTAVFVCRKRRREFSYPVRYFSWRGPSRIKQDEDLAAVAKLCNVARYAAVPIDSAEPSSPWLTAPRKALKGIQKAIGQSDYSGFAGCCCWLNGAFWIRILKVLDDGALLVENMHDVGKTTLNRVQGVIESDLVYPLLRGRDVSGWRAEPSAWIILAQDPDTRRGIPESEMKRKRPKTYAYLKNFERQLRNRSGYRKYFKPSDPFYSMYNVGPYTLEPWKVVWRDMGSEIQVAVVGRHEGRVVCPEHHVMAVAVESAREAYYLSGVLMSSPVQALVAGYTTTTGISTHVLHHVKVPDYREKDAGHARISGLSRRCHHAAIEGENETLRGLERELDEAAALLWGMTRPELKAVQDSLPQMRDEKGGRRKPQSPGHI